MVAAITIPGMFLTGDHASRPAASAVGKGSLYACSTHGLIYQSDGSSWSTWATLGETGTATHIADASDAHDASAISFSPTGSVAATDVQAAIAEVASEAAGATGNVLRVIAPGADITSTSTGGSANSGYAMPFSIPGPMLLRACRFRVQTGGSGTVQWGLFDYSATPAACTKLAGASAALNSTGWVDIAATGAPVSVSSGNYMLIIHLPSSNAPALSTVNNGTTAGLLKSQSSYVWDDTPDITSGWTASTSQFSIMLIGDANGSNQW